MFPHYTWGYIIYDAAKFGLPVVPSLYVRVYRHCRRQAYHYRSSLTIREGISPTAVIKKELSWFPHYTWGYIELERAPFKKQVVPSLYVRVYRNTIWDSSGYIGSLTIREGISCVQFFKVWALAFPHYTWWYIGIIKTGAKMNPVPSLYVRVYHVGGARLVFSGCSLTIREGISQRTTPRHAAGQFPHYTWGYIVIFAAECLFQFVPSLHVRVYRKEMQKKTQKLRSLIICECILVIFASSRIPHIKNVKIFQKIHTKKGNQKYE